MYGGVKGAGVGGGGGGGSDSLLVFGTRDNTAAITQRPLNWWQGG